MTTKELSKIDIMRKLLTPTGRASLPAQSEPYWARRAKGRFLGLAISALGTMYWRARIRMPSGEQEFKALGECLDGVFEFDEAAAAADKWFREMIQGVYGRGADGGAYTVADACLDHLDRAEKLGNPVTARAMRRTYERIVLGSTTHPRDPIADVAMTERDLTPGEINVWIQRHRVNAKGKAVSMNTTERDLKQLRAALNGAVNLRKCPADVAFAWKNDQNKLKHDDSITRREIYLSPAEVDRWIDAVRALCVSTFGETTGADLLRLQYLTGARPGRELTTLVAGNFDARSRTLTICKGKTNRRRVRLCDQAVALLSQLCADKLPLAPIFMHKGEPVAPGTFRVIAKTARDACRLPAATVPYSLRHSFITDAILVRRRTASEVANHCGNSIEMIEKHYLHLFTQVSDTLNHQQSA